jgi:hypothetical protein
MAKSRKRKPKRTQSLLPAARQPVRPPLHKRLLTGRAIFIELLTAVTGIIALWEFWIQTIPEIRPVGADPSQPFLLPFAVKNGSSFFWITDVTWLCAFEFKNIFGGSANVPGGVGRGTHTEIAPRATADYRCSVNLPPTAELTSLSATLKLEYRTFGFSRRHAVEFTWIRAGAHSQWTEGKVVEP